MNWDDSQRGVIEAPHAARLLVGAGPGTGKTSVACARVARLIQNGLGPESVWLISFTRTAVQEIRDRIADHLDDREDAFAVNLATLDSYAWSIHSGFEGSAALTTYEENIASVLELVRSDEAVEEYLRGVGHLVVDEAQDIVGLRSDLVIEMARKLDDDAGVTVFADDAQAIYGFAEERDASTDAPPEPPLSVAIRRGEAGPFTEVELTKVHRTRSRRLKALFAASRRRLLEDIVPPAELLDTIRNDVQAASRGRAPRAGDSGFPDRDDLLVLFRRRAEVLIASSFLASAGKPHRLRMSGFPERLVPWIGAALSETVSVRLGRHAFMDLWAERVEGTSLASCEASEAWEQLYRLAGAQGDVLDMRRLRQVLGRSRPPADLCLPDLGDRGPVIGTIHASKGRESEHVHLMLPLPVNEEGDGDDEEARVVFVGATRGRSRLLVGQGYRQYPKRTSSGRVYQLHTANGKPKAQVEIGREGDLVAEGLAGRTLYADAESVHRAQTTVMGLSSEIQSIVARADKDNGFAYRLMAPTGADCLGVLAKSVNIDLFSIADHVQNATNSRRLRPPDRIPHISVRGLRTIVLPPDSPEADTLHDPWRKTGILLAPVVVGYTTLYFPQRRNRHA